MLQVRGVCHAFAERPVLDDVTFDVPSGVLTGLLGPNGAGKTTLVRLLTGQREPDAGTIAIGTTVVAATLPQNYVAFEYPVGRPAWWYDIIEGLPNVRQKRCESHVPTQ